MGVQSLLLRVLQTSVSFFIEQSDLKIVADSGDLLNAFCSWQKKHDPPDQGDAKYPDVSILSTKYVNKVNIFLWWLADIRR